METKIKPTLKLNRSNFIIDSSLSGKLEIALNSPDVIRMQEELRAAVSKLKHFSK